jgi:hypothetical protein
LVWPKFIAIFYCNFIARLFYCICRMWTQYSHSIMRNISKYTSALNKTHNFSKNSKIRNSQIIFFSSMFLVKTQNPSQLKINSTRGLVHIFSNLHIFAFFLLMGSSSVCTLEWNHVLMRSNSRMPALLIQWFCLLFLQFVVGP